MSLPSTIRSHVDPAAVTKVTRLFNNTLTDILSELIQNARRAGATRVELTTSIIDDTTWLTVADDGVGIADPSVLLALGKSGWGDDVVAREDPAGMGVYSLAGRSVEISSRAPSGAQGWTIAIPPEAWENGTPIAVEPCDMPTGTRIRFPLTAPSPIRLSGDARAAARYCPVPVSLDGIALGREDFLDGADVVVERDGVRIGLFRSPHTRHFSTSINFHGVVVGCMLPSVAERDRHWAVRVDIVDAPHLALVLPARKEMVENAALDQLRQTIRQAIYAHIRTLGNHSLNFTSWHEAADLGIRLPEARPELRAWQPRFSDTNSGNDSKAIAVHAAAIIVDAFTIGIEQSAALALADDSRFAGRLVGTDYGMIGYSWYDSLPNIIDLQFTFDADGETYVYDEDTAPDVESGVVENLALTVRLASGGAEADYRLPARGAVVYDDDRYCVEEARIIIAERGALKPEELVDLLDAICFCASDDKESDSWDTQHDSFLADAREIATTFLFGEDEALIERMRNIIAFRAQWLVPPGRRLTVSITSDAVDVALAPFAPAAPG